MSAKRAARIDKSQKRKPPTRNADRSTEGRLRKVSSYGMEEEGRPNDGREMWEHLGGGARGTILRSSDVQLERLEAAANGGATRTFPIGALLGHENLNTNSTEPTYALRAGVRVPQQRGVVAHGAIDLDVM